MANWNAHPAEAWWCAKIIFGGADWTDYMHLYSDAEDPPEVPPVAGMLKWTVRPTPQNEKWKECENGCREIIRTFKDFCSGECWDEWHLGEAA